MTEPKDFDGVVADIVVDCYGDDEEDTAFLTVFEEECELPATATLLGSPVTVTGFDQAPRSLVATCQGTHGTGEVSLADLAFPPDTVAAWIHAAYRYYLGLPPFAALPRPDRSCGV